MNRNKQKGAVSVGMILLIIVLGLGAVAVAAVLMLVSAGNTANRLEAGLDATLENNQNILSNYGQKVLEAAQVPDMMRDDLVVVARAALEGRYGAEGSKAVFQMVTEQNPVVSEQLYMKLQTIIEAGRNEFQINQTRLIDQKRVYETALGQIPGGFLMRVMGYPKKDLSRYKPVITDGVARTFETGREQSPIQLRPAK